MAFPEVKQTWFGTFKGDKENLMALMKKPLQIPTKKRAITTFYGTEWIAFMQRYSNVMAVLCQNPTVVRVHFATYM